MEMFRHKSTEHWVKVINGAGVPCGPINKVSQVVTNPQVLARNMIAEMEHPNVPELKTPGSPLKLTESPAVPSAVRRPCWVQHNDEVLAEHGFTAEQIADLRERGVIGG